MNEDIIASEFDRVKDKFGSIHNELSQTIDEARNKIEVQIEGRLSITIRNAALSQDIVTEEDRARFTQFVVKFQQLPEIKTVDLVERNSNIFVENLQDAKHVLNEFRPIVWNQNDSIYYNRLYKSISSKLILKDPTVGTILSVVRDDKEDITDLYNKFLKNHRDAIRFILKSYEPDLDYLYNGVLQHSDKDFSERLAAEFYSGELSYLLIKNAFLLGPVKQLLIPFSEVS
jgi:hypothetical protein